MLQTVFVRLVGLTVLLPRSCIGSLYVAGMHGDCRAGAGGATSAEGDHEGWYWESPAAWRGEAAGSGCRAGAIRLRRARPCVVAKSPGLPGGRAPSRSLLSQPA
jgi:hypothetical protein